MIRHLINGQDENRFGVFRRIIPRLYAVDPEAMMQVVTFTADIGQGGEVEPARAKAQQMGVKEIYIEDLTGQFVSEYVFLLRANTVEVLISTKYRATFDC